MQVVQSNDGVAFTTLDNSDTHHNTNETNMSHMDDLSTTSDLTASTNPQQHRSTMVTTGGGHGHSHNAHRSTGCGINEGHTIRCFCCGKTRHYASTCPYSLEEVQQCLAATQSANGDGDSETAKQLFMSGAISGAPEDIDTAYQFLISTNGTPQTCHGAHIPKEWILLDSQSTVSIFSNCQLLRNIRKSDGWMHIHCNAGITRMNLVGNLSGYGTVWYHPDGIANILSLAEV